MNQKFERIEKHLYRRQYQTAGGEWSTLYYARFTDWKGKQRAFPLGSELKTARDELTIYEARNIRREDFDADKQNKRGLTFSEWAGIYFRDKIDPEKRAGGIDREKRSFKALEPFFGDMELSAITRSKVMEYRAKRGQDPIIRREKIVQGKRLSFATINRELAFLRFLLNLAEDDGIIERAPKIKLPTEKDRKRDRIASEEEYNELLSQMKRPAQRVLIGLYETAARVNELLRIRWDQHVDERAGFIRLKAEETKEKKPRSIPISPDLSAVLNELKAEQRKVGNISNRVFTNRGRPILSIRTAFELAREKAKIRDLHLHDLRHTAITRWSAMGIPRDIVMAASGHHSIQVHDGYVNIKENHIKDAFSVATTLLHGKSVENESAASY
jgi:integrase